jgi:hypothetical protein
LREHQDDGIVVDHTGEDMADWDIRREGRAWAESEALERYSRAPEKIEMVDGKLFWDEDERLTMLGLLLENLGADAAVRLGRPEVWQQAVRQFR